MFLQRLNEWDTNDYSKKHNEFGKKTTAGGDIRGMIDHHERMLSDSYFNSYYQRFTEVYEREIYRPYAEFFDRGEKWKSTKGMLSLFWGLDDYKNYTVDSLWPRGFGVY